jgi:pyridoxal biosynthesis lyase PdxS
MCTARKTGTVGVYECVLHVKQVQSDCTNVYCTGNRYSRSVRMCTARETGTVGVYECVLHVKQVQSECTNVYCT